MVTVFESQERYGTWTLKYAYYGLCICEMVIIRSPTRRIASYWNGLTSQMALLTGQIICMANIEVGHACQWVKKLNKRNKNSALARREFEPATSHTSRPRGTAVPDKSTCHLLSASSPFKQHNSHNAHKRSKQS